MTLNQLSYFIATCENGNSMTKASRELFVTQSAISLAIRDLEREFNVQLFFRNKNQLFLTETGRRFYELAKHVVDAAELLRDTYQEEFAHAPGMRVGMTALIQKMMSQQMTTDEWGRFSPYAVRSTYVLDTPALRHLLDWGKIDLAVIGSSRYDDFINYDSVVICDRYVRLYVSVDSPLAQKEQIQPVELREEPMLLFLEDSSNIDKAAEVLQRFVPNLQLNQVSGYTTFLDTVEDFVEKGKGCALLAEGALRPNDKIGMLPVAESKPFQVVVLWKKGHGLSTPAKRYIEYLQHIFQND